MRKTKLKKSFFTIVELMVAMAIFAILMLILMQIFNSTQDVWKRTTVKSDSYENARIALNMIEADLMSAIYVDNPTGIGRSFYTDNSTVLWFPTIKPYLIDPENQKLKEVEVAYYLDSTSYTDEISGLGGLRRLKYSVRTDKEGLTFRTATSTVSNKTDRGIILENILSWTIAPLYRNASNNYKPVTDPTDPDEPTDPTTPTDPTDPTDPAKPEQPGKPSEQTESPQTGDSSNMMLWISLMLVSCGGVLGMLLYRRKKAAAGK